MKEIIQFSHANGFPGSTYRTLYSLLEDEFEIHYIDILGHNPKFPVSDNWTTLAHELIAELESQKLKNPVIGVGHSLGGAITLFAAILRPDLFKMIVLLDTPVLAYPRALLVQLFKNLGQTQWITPGGRVKRRKTTWQSIDEVITFFKTRPLFKHFNEQCLRDYAVYGTVESKEGLKLKFDPSVESTIYLTLPHNYAKYKHKLKVPGVALIGEESKLISNLDIRSMRKNFHLHCELVPGGHLFPFEYPVETAEAIKAAVKAYSL